MNQISRNFIFVLFLVFGAMSYQCKTFGLANAEVRKYSQEFEFRKLDKNRSFLKAKQWFNYRLDGTKAVVLLEDQGQGILKGKAVFECRVPYGVEEVDVNNHEFQYTLQISDNKAQIEFENIYSYSRDPNDITISYGPRNEREAMITIRICFMPLAEDLFNYIQ
ncbi:DUF4468 domain-containing protein [Leptospira sp. GIMC2001]|uniref:DUF4468 domain-containing protein n=1 Tax=Leptospira sp. GIMC2001 TaxID=1513297 RepID=UPI0023494043|nr:DUF4468 domain-containing protein [Leptospira sp. GIMC2001]WCL49721.1 DUF4468 domain-containing protein [Leptospira sp. GIMC2001]